MSSSEYDWDTLDVDESSEMDVTHPSTSTPSPPSSHESELTDMEEASSETMAASIDSLSQDSTTEEGFLDPIVPDESVIQLVSRIAQEQFGITACAPRIINTAEGSFNFVYIVKINQHKSSMRTAPTRLVVRIPKMNADASLDPLAIHAQESQITTLRLIRERTTAPVPEVYDYDTTDDNEIGMPYMCISFLPGKPLYQLLREPQANNEEIRLNVLSSLAEATAQLTSVSFSHGGSICGTEEALAITPFFVDATKDEGIPAVAQAPWYTTEGEIRLWMDMYERSLLDETLEDTPQSVGEDIIMRKLLMCMRIIEGWRTTYPKEFVLMAPDLDSQNILVDDEGNVTGLIDWDFVRTVPWYLGCSGYPKFLTMDWDPLRTDWDRTKGDNFVPSWGQFGEYRWFYRRELQRAQGVEEHVAIDQIMIRSHLFAAIQRAVYHPKQRTQICAHFILTALTLHNDSTFIDMTVVRGVVNEINWNGEWEMNYEEMIDFVEWYGVAPEGVLRRLEQCLERLLLGREIPDN